MLDGDWFCLQQVLELLHVGKAASHFHQPFFMEIFTIAAWEIWKIRNARIFHGDPPSIQKWKSNFIDSVHLQMHRLRDPLLSLVSLWISLFV